MKYVKLKLAEIVQNFAVKENDDNLRIYMKQQKIILDILVYREKTIPEKVNNEAFLESKGTFVKLPKFELPDF